MTRIFLVGCPRSGTTILQREISQKLGLCTFPETSFLVRGLGDVSQRAAALWRLHNRVQNQFRGDLTYPHFNQLRKFAEIARYYPPRIGPPRFIKALISKKYALKGWAALLDAIASEKGANGWLEKSPTHFYHIDALRKTADNVRVLFVFRDGRDAVASIIHRARTYPDRFGHEDLDQAATLWNDAVRIASQKTDANNVGLINYETFLDDPVSFIARIGTFCGIQPDRDAPTETPTGPGKQEFAFSFEEWKASTRGTVSRPVKKWHTVLTENERKQIMDMLDWERYATLEFLS